MHKSTQPKLSSQSCCDQFQLRATKSLKFQESEVVGGRQKSQGIAFEDMAIRGKPENQQAKTELLSA
jgi:hypothetical protein